MHFGEHDAGIPLENVKTIGEAHPDAVVHIYDADHGFNCDARASHDPERAGIARQRTLAFFTLRVGAA